MESFTLENILKEIVVEARTLRDKHTTEFRAPVNYVAVFAQTKFEFIKLLNAVSELGKVIKETSTGPLFLIRTIETVSGPLRLIKIREPDTTRPERGDADFTVDDYVKFKAQVLTKSGFSVIERPEMEMIELVDPKFSVRAYFSNQPLIKQLGTCPPLGG